MTFVVLQAKHPSLSLVPSFPETNSRISNRHGYHPKERVNEEMPLHLAAAEVRIVFVDIGVTGSGE